MPWNRRNTVPRFAIKDPINSVDTYININELPPSCSDSRSNELPCKMSSRRRSKRHHFKHENKDVKRHLGSSKSSKDKYDPRSESESEEEDRLMHKKNVRHRRIRDSGTDSESSVYRHDSKHGHDKEL